MEAAGHTVPASRGLGIKTRGFEEVLVPVHDRRADRDGHTVHLALKPRGGEAVGDQTVGQQLVVTRSLRSVSQPLLRETCNQGGGDEDRIAWAAPRDAGGV